MSETITLESSPFKSCSSQFPIQVFQTQSHFLSNETLLSVDEENICSLNDLLCCLVMSDTLRPHGLSMEFSRPEYWSG